MRVRLVVTPELGQQLAERDVRAPVIVEREARLEVGLRLAPQPLALAQSSERVEQRRVLVVHREPALGDLELARRIGRAALRVREKQARLPVALETSGENVGGFAIAALREKAARRGARDLRLQAVAFGHARPVRAQT